MLEKRKVKEKEKVKKEEKVKKKGREVEVKE